MVLVWNNLHVLENKIKIAPCFLNKISKTIEKRKKQELLTKKYQRYLIKYWLSKSMLKARISKINNSVVYWQMEECGEGHAMMNNNVSEEVRSYWVCFNDFHTLKPNLRPT